MWPLDGSSRDEGSSNGGSSSILGAYQYIPECLPSPLRPPPLLDQLCAYAIATGKRERERIRMQEDVASVVAATAAAAAAIFMPTALVFG